MMDNYCCDMSEEEMARLVEQMEKITDYIFKKYTQCENSKRDENDENGVVMVLHEDRNEMTQNLNSALSEYFMQRSMIKIMDDIIEDGNKDESENNKNETDKITERLMDDTIE